MFKKENCICDQCRETIYNYWELPDWKSDRIPDKKYIRAGQISEWGVFNVFFNCPNCDHPFSLFYDRTGRQIK